MTGDAVDGPTDEDIERRLAEVPPDVWTGLWAAVDALAEVDKISTIEGGEPIDTTSVDGVERRVYQMPHVVCCAEVHAVIQILHRADLIMPFDWPHWPGTRLYQENAAALATAPVAESVRMLTAVIRADRFTDGAIGGAIESGLFPAALRRIRRWCEENRSPAVLHPRPS